MDSVVPTPDEIKRQKKLMRRIRVAEEVDPDSVPNTPQQQKKIDKAMKRIIKDSLDNISPEKH